MNKAVSMGIAYHELLMDIYNNGITEVNSRTNTEIKMLEGGYSFKLDLSSGRLPVAGNRRYFPRVAAAEVAWQFMGTKDPTFILKYAPKLWKKFLEDETVVSDHGYTAPRKILKAAYGYRWMRHFGRDQLALAINELMYNPTNRQLYISAWDPATDGLGSPDQPMNIPCPVGFSLTRTGDNLHMSVFIRSSDVFVGLPYDVMAYSLMLDAIAASCDCTPASIHFTLAHPHIYAPHFKMLEACTVGLTGDDAWRDKDMMNRSNWMGSTVEPIMPGWPVEMIQDRPDDYVEQIGILARRAGKHDWNPMPSVVV